MDGINRKLEDRKKIWNLIVRCVGERAVKDEVQGSSILYLHVLGNEVLLLF